MGRGERAVTVEVSGAAGLAAGARVDVLVSTESGAGGGRTLMALAGAELLRARRPDRAADGGAADGGAAAAGPSALATLRVTLRQAVYLTAADNFAREIRLLAPPAGRPLCRRRRGLPRPALKGSAGGSTRCDVCGRFRVEPAGRGVPGARPCRPGGPAGPARPCRGRGRGRPRRARARGASARAAGSVPARDRGVQDVVALVGDERLGPVLDAQLASREQLTTAAGACPASRTAPPRPAARKRSPRRSTFFDASATTTKRRAAEITIFSRSSAPPPPLISPSEPSTSSAPSRARSSSKVPSSSTHLDAGRERALAGQLRGDHRAGAAPAAAPRPPKRPAQSPARSSCRAPRARAAASAAASRAALTERELRTLGGETYYPYTHLR